RTPGRGPRRRPRPRPPAPARARAAPARAARGRAPRRRGRPPPWPRALRRARAPPRSARWAPRSLLLLALLVVLGLAAEGREEGALRDLHVAHVLHPLLALLLLLEQLALARDVAAVALGGHVLAERLDRLARDHPPADRGLDRHVEHVARDLLAQPLAHVAPALLRVVTVADRRERVDRRPVHEDVELDQVGREEAEQLVGERGVALAPRLELVVVVEHDLGQRHVVDQDHARRAEVLLP